MVQNQQCRRCREWVSVELDSPLSQFEQALMRRHLSRCAECASFAADVRGATALLRTAEAVPLPAPLALHLPRSAGQLLARTGMVAAVAAAAAAAVLTNGLTGTSPLGTTATAQAQSTADLVSMRLDRSQQLRASNQRPRVIVVDWPSRRNIEWPGEVQDLDMMISPVSSYVWHLDHVDRVSAALKRSELLWSSSPDSRSGNLRLPGLLARAFRTRRRGTVPSTLVEEL